MDNTSTPASFMTVEKLNDIEKAYYLPLVIFLIVLMIIGIIGNLFVVCIFKKKFKRSSARIYIIALAMADMSVCVVGIPYHVLDLTWILTYTHTPVCKLLSFLVSSCTLSSIFILLVVGLNRYLKVCRPLKYQIRDFGDRKACLIAVVLATISSIPNGFLYGTSSVYEYMESYNITGVECFIDDAYLDSPLGIGYMGYKMLLFLLSVGFLVVIYGLIGRTIYQHDRMAITLERSAYRCFCCRVDNDNDDDMDYCEDGNDLDEIRMSALDVKHNTVRRSTEHPMDNDLDDLDGDASKNSPDASKNSPDTSSKPVNKKHGQSIVKQSKDKKDKHKKQLRETMIRHSPPGQKAKEKTTRKITLMMMTITVIFIVTFLPFIIISFLDSMDEAFWLYLSYPEAILYDFLLRLYLVNNIANPFIYSFWDKKFRKEFVMFLMRLYCCKKTREREHD
ncbi:D(2) dopamine receptor A-like [Mya arenaria]|uniref:D(2) dopamine receptor A-like n=1 Tax=Mya arenaria TaxID=6604 RepID=UPI0022DFF9AA|nr:D(2) dopamine receptor A-like [Mya arenaria]